MNDGYHQNRIMDECGLGVPDLSAKGATARVSTPFCSISRDLKGKCNKDGGGMLRCIDRNTNLGLCKIRCTSTESDLLS